MSRCCFCGHGRDEDTPSVIFDKIVEFLEIMININHVNEFYSGGMGKFDKMAEQAVIQLKKKYPYIKLFLVMPYLKKSINSDGEVLKKRYDELILPDLGEVYYKAAIQKRNRWMIDNSDFMIAYVKNSYGGAHQSYNYAIKKNINIINLADYQ